MLKQTINFGKAILSDRQYSLAAPAATRGFAAIEMALVAPVLLVIIMGSYDASRVLIYQTECTYAVDEIGMAVSNSVEIATITRSSVQEGLTTLFAAMPQLQLEYGGSNGGSIQSPLTNFTATVTAVYFGTAVGTGCTATGGQGGANCSNPANVEWVAQLTSPTSASGSQCLATSTTGSSTSGGQNFPLACVSLGLSMCGTLQLVPDTQQQTNWTTFPGLQHNIPTELATNTFMNNLAGRTVFMTDLQFTFSPRFSTWLVGPITIATTGYAAPRNGSIAEQRIDFVPTSGTLASNTGGTVTSDSTSNIPYAVICPGYL